ncbi:MAG: isoprenylcysteine carboxylmethyltransferase family protein [Cyclobacteriaceae bacterium]|nr:isoprenylcysteine carboxylmethyltransferase family protein [Cyclobacteriaceae bacterium]
MFNSIFKIVYFIEFLVAVVIRKIFTAKHRKMDFAVDRKSPGDVVLLTLDGIGMTIPIIYVFSTWLDIADYNAPDWVGWIGAGLFAFAIWILYRSHADLGKNWTPVLAIQKEHSLVTNGIYKYIRHPMYASHLLWAVAQILILHNWIAGFSFIVVMVPHYLMRAGTEEKMMIDQFGSAYEVYMKKTGRVLPKVI